ncbi:MAG: terpene cyclase/mutase family protein [Bacteroidetes bacterium]|nr:terpene cyclase/mutase family protein [Bacteroidota bacterium]
MKNLFKKIIVLFSLGFVLFGFNFVSAEDLSPVDIHLEIKTTTSSFYNSNISVTACDSDNNGTLKTTPYCAINQSGIPSVWDWTWAPGAFVTSINNVSGYTTKDKDNNDVYHYWSWSLNGNEAMMGLNVYELQPGDSVLLNFIDPIEEVIPEEIIPVVNHSSSKSYVSTPIVLVTKNFSIPEAVKFLSLNQKENGSFDGDLYTDWVAVGVAKTEFESTVLKNKLIDYLKNYELKSDIITDNERHAMALMALGINPYTGTKINYIEKIANSFDREQIGDKSIYNDDIFSLIVLSKVDYTEKDEMIQKIISNIILNQSSDGSWGSVDMTSAGIQALNNFRNFNGVSGSILKAETYLKNNQKEDSSFGDIFSTSWAIQAMSLDSSNKDKIEKAISYLSENQKEDGGLDQNEKENRIWATAYAIPAVLKLSWNDILNSFPRENLVNKNKEEVKIIPVKNYKKEITKEVLSKKDSVILEKDKIKDNLSTKTTIWQKIKAPFAWLFIHLGF